jgi:hypothetical protein
MNTSLKDKKFSMEDVKAAHALKPYLPEKKFIKQFAFLNYKISKGWTEDRIIKYVDLLLSEIDTDVQNISKKETN